MNGHTMEVMPDLACDVLRGYVVARLVEDDDDRQIRRPPTVSRTNFVQSQPLTGRPLSFKTASKSYLTATSI